MRLRYSRPSRSDLREIFDYIAADSPRAANRVVRLLRARCAELRDSPHAFPVWQDKPELELHRRVVDSYLVFYRIRHDVVEVVRIVHGARNLGRVFGDD